MAGTLTWTQLCASCLTGATTLFPEQFGMGYNGTRVIAYGGEVANTDPKDITGTFDGVSTWSQITTATLAPSRVGFLQGHRPVRLAFDGTDLISFGGLENGPVTHNQTWKFVDATPNWVQLSPAHNPLLRESSGLASDGTNVILFGGLNDGAGTYYQDTWKWTHASGDWTDLTGVTKPSARNNHCFEWDPISGTFILFGGIASDGTTLLDDTWSCSTSGVWTQLSPTTVPVASSGGVLFWEGSRLVLFTGGGPATTSYSYVWTGTDWEEPTVVNQPSNRSQAGACFSTIGLMAGGDIGATQATDTWTVDYEGAVPPPTSFASIQTRFGQ